MLARTHDMMVAVFNWHKRLLLLFFFKLLLSSEGLWLCICVKHKCQKRFYVFLNIFCHVFTFYLFNVF